MKMHFKFLFKKMKRIFRLKTFVNNGLQIQGQEILRCNANRFDFSFNLNVERT